VKHEQGEGNALADGWFDDNRTYKHRGDVDEQRKRCQDLQTVNDWGFKSATGSGV
jgi:hypothetical protein